MPDPRDPGYEDALVTQVERFVERVLTSGEKRVMLANLRVRLCDCFTQLSCSNNFCSNTGVFSTASTSTMAPTTTS